MPNQNNVSVLMRNKHKIKSNRNQSFKQHNSLNFESNRIYDLIQNAADDVGLGGCP